MDEKVQMPSKEEIEYLATYWRRMEAQDYQGGVMLERTIALIDHTLADLAHPASDAPCPNASRYDSGNCCGGACFTGNRVSGGEAEPTHIEHIKSGQDYMCQAEAARKYRAVEPLLREMCEQFGSPAHEMHPDSFIRLRGNFVTAIAAIIEDKP